MAPEPIPTNSADDLPATAKAPAPEPLAVDAAGLGRLLGLDRSSIWKLLSAGRLPEPVRLGAKSPRWNVSEIQRWLDAGAPDRRTWARMKREKQEGVR